LYLREWFAWAAEAQQPATASRAACLAELITLVLQAGGRVLACGNGGSAADAGHFAGELAGRFALDRAAVPALALAEQTATVTAVANDYGYEHVFSRQVEALGQPGDCLLALTTSGRSPNVAAAVRAAKARGMVAAVLSGPDGVPSSLERYVDLAIAVVRPEASAATLATPHIQEVHMAVLHAVAASVERALVRNPGVAACFDPWRGRRVRRPAVFLDRDGTLVAKRDAVTEPSQLELLPGAADAVRRLKQAGLAAVLATNQAAVGRGQLDEENLFRIHLHLQRLLAAHGAELDAIYHCPHPDPCACRKPLPGMMLRAGAELGLDLAASWTVGDTWQDVRAGLSSGGRGILVRTGLGAHQLPATSVLPDEPGQRWSVADDIAAAAEAILSTLRPGQRG
jgi:D-sedoheptulose 7-phosphate isomerase